MRLIHNNHIPLRLHCGIKTSFIPGDEVDRSDEKSLVAGELTWLCIKRGFVNQPEVKSKLILQKATHDFVLAHFLLPLTCQAAWGDDEDFIEHTTEK